VQTSGWLLVSSAVMAVALVLVALGEELAAVSVARDSDRNPPLLIAGALLLIAAAFGSHADLSWRLLAGAVGLFLGTVGAGVLDLTGFRGRRIRSLNSPKRLSSSEPLSLASWLPLIGVLLVAPVLWFPQVRPDLLFPVLIACALLAVVGVLRDKSSSPGSSLGLALILLELTAGAALLYAQDRALALPKGTSFLLGLALYHALLELPERVRPRATLAVMGGLALLFSCVGLTNGVVSAKIPVFVTIRHRLPQLLVELPGTQNGKVSMNQLGGALLLVVPVLWPISLAHLKNRDYRRWVGLLALVLSLLLSAVLLVTQSRAAWAGLAVGAVILLALGARWAKSALVMVLIVCLCGWLLWGRELLAPLITQAFTASRGPTTAIGTLSLSGRVQIWQAVLASIAESPWLGCGWGSLRATAYTHAHNVFLQVAYDIGLPGLTAYLALTIAAVRHCWRVLHSATDAHRLLALGCLAALASYHVYGLFDVVALGSKPGMLWWCLLALVASLGEESAYWADQA
jgi:putative inorganic carbon (hco3(-)) transporter